MVHKVEDDKYSILTLSKLYNRILIKKNRNRWRRIQWWKSREDTGHLSLTYQSSKTARTRIKECRQKLAQHELYVAQFYFEREKFKGVVRRTNYLLGHYPNLGLDPQALLLGAKAHIAQDEPTKAREKLSRLVDEFSSTDEAKTAQELLQSLPVNPQKEG